MRPRKLFLILFLSILLTSLNVFADSDSHLKLRFDPSTVSFPNTRVGQASSSQTITVSAVKRSESDLDCSGFVGCHGIKIGKVSLSNSTDYNLTSDACSGRTLNKNQSCRVSVTFNPQESRSFIAFVNFPTSKKLYFVPMKGKGIAPAVTLSINVAHFGDQTIGKSSTYAVNVTNSGTDVLSITNLAISGDSVFTQTNNCTSSVIAVGDSCTVTLLFTPIAVASYSAVLDITDDAPGSPQTVTMDGKGVAPPVPDPAFEPDNLDFGVQQVNTTSLAQTITVTNLGGATLNITSIAGSGAFSVVGGSNCLTVPVPVNGGTCTFESVFAPTTPGNQSGNITITDNATDSPQSIPVVGIGFVPDTPSSSLSANSIDFGKVVVDTTAGPKTVTLTNTGTSNLAIASVSVTGDNGNGFAEKDDCDGVTLPQGGTCTFSVSFSPIEVNGYLANISIVSNASGSPQNIDLLGQGVAASGGSGGGCGCDFNSSKPFYSLFKLGLLMIMINFLFLRFVYRRRLKK